MPFDLDCRAKHFALDTNHDDPPARPATTESKPMNDENEHEKVIELDLEPMDGFPIELLQVRE